MTIAFVRYEFGNVFYRPFPKFPSEYDWEEYHRALDVVVSTGHWILDIPEIKMPVVVAALRLQGFEISGWQCDQR